MFLSKSMVNVIRNVNSWITFEVKFHFFKTKSVKSISSFNDSSIYHQLTNAAKISNIAQNEIIDFIPDTIIIRTGDNVELRANKSNLMMNSIVFEKMFTHDMIEKLSGVVHIIDFDHETIGELLRYVYIRKVKNLQDIYLAMEIYKAARRFEIEKLPGICLKAITSNVSKFNVFDVIPLSDLYNLEELFMVCCKVILK